jgi:hypothetical protein
MITVKLNGGLGNQMFQYAFGRSLAVQKKTNLLLDISNFDRDTKRSFLLHQYNIKAEAFKPNLINKITRKLKLTKIIGETTYKPENIKENVLYDGYWQNEIYFKNLRPLLLNELSLKTETSSETKSWLSKIKKCESVSVHVRRGDYMEEKHKKLFGVLEKDYYVNAINRMKKVIANPSFFLFSDDVNWCKENLSDITRLYYVSGNKIKITEELFLMSECNHNIIANSSFSWWGAWLNQSPNKIVITPKNWFVDKTKEPTNIVPSEWEQI